MRNINYSRIMPSPSIQASGLVISELSDTQLRLTGTRGNGIGWILVAKLSTSSLVTPTEHTTYTDNSIFGSGSDLGGGNYVVYKGIGTTVLITGLADTTAYDFYAYEFNKKEDGTERYNISSATVSATTLVPQVAPTVQSTSLIFRGDRQLDWIVGNGTKRLVVVRQGGAVNITPVDNTIYTANSEFGSGSELGIGNFVVYDGTSNTCYINGLDYDIDYGIRVFEYNLASGNAKYNTNTATGNPLAHHTITEQIWYSYKGAIAQSRRDIYNPQTTSFIASKAYSGSFYESATERWLYVVGDNQNDIPTTSDWDQTFLWYQDIADSPEDINSWQSYRNGTDEPIPILAIGFAESDGSSVQNWLGTITNTGSSLLAYRSVNVGNNATRYSLGKTLVAADGRTVTRQTPYVFTQGAGNNYYQFAQAFWDADISKVVLLRINGGVGTEGRWARTDALVSTDGATGESFTLLASDIYNSTPIDEQGFGLQGPIWKEGGRYHWFHVTNNVPDFKGQPSVDTLPIYPWLNNQIIEVSCDISFATKPIVERVIYSSPFDAEVGIFPGSKKFSHGGKDYIVINTFRWKIEGKTSAFYQANLDVKLLVNNTVTGTLIGRDIYPSYIKRIYKMHQTQLNDNYGSTTLLPKEILTGESIDITGSPTQYGMNRVNVNNGYLVEKTETVFSSGYDQYLGVKISMNGTQLNDNVTRGILEKAGVFEISFYQDKFLQVKLYGAGGGFKLYRSMLSTPNWDINLYGPAGNMDVGFVARLNGGGTDIDLSLIIDYKILVGSDVTKVTDNTFTSIVTNSNKLTFGRVIGMTQFTKDVGPTIIMYGSEATTDNWIKEAIN